MGNSKIIGLLISTWPNAFSPLQLFLPIDCPSISIHAYATIVREITNYIICIQTSISDIRYHLLWAILIPNKVTSKNCRVQTTISTTNTRNADIKHGIHDIDIVECINVGGFSCGDDAEGANCLSKLWLPTCISIIVVVVVISVELESCRWRCSYDDGRLVL